MSAWSSAVTAPMRYCTDYVAGIDVVAGADVVDVVVGAAEWAADPHADALMMRTVERNRAARGSLR